ncbi:odorant receptor 226 [Nasonia vitripennis]|uniref:Odorant receptor n=1 Tax=Nasonia vitripennis TaxID=7425 RepID=A0A7M6USI6_NASVI|nr:odorant receptor 226 [Nasonia vitripennis]
MSAKKKVQKEGDTFLSLSWSHILFLRVASFLPLKGKSFSHPLSLLLQLWDHINVIAFTSLWQGYGYRMIKRGEMEIDFICENIITIGFTLRYIILCLNRELLCHLVESCEKLWDLLEDGETVFVRQFERKGYNFRNFFFGNLMFMATLYTITAAFVKLPPMEPNGTETRMLPFRFFMDVQENPGYAAAFVFQDVVVFYTDVIFASAETVPLYLVLMACGYLRAVRNRLLKIEGNDNDSSEKGEAALKVVVGCAHFHQQIMIYCEEIGQMTKTLFLVSCFAPIYNVSIAGIKLLENDEDKFKFIVILVYNYFQFFICQWAPEYLTEESESIAVAAYSASLRPQAPSHRQKINGILYFMIMRAQKPVQLTAGGFVNLSIQTFGAMTKSAFSFFTVLRNFSG